MDFSLITGAISSLTSAKKLADAALQVRDFNQASAAISQINDQLLEAQQRLFAHNAALLMLQQQHFEATNEIRELKEALAERGRYSLFELSEGVFVYRVHQVPQQGGTTEPGEAEPQHYLCQGCFDKGIKSVLQKGSRVGHLYLLCPQCDSKFPTGAYVKPPDLKVRRARSPYL